MGGFDSYIGELRDSVESLQGEHATREFCWPGSTGALVDDLCVRVGPGANRGIILRGDTFVELGNPVAGSVAMVLWSDDPSLVVDGRVTLVGPDIPESEGGSLPFGQVLLVAGPSLSAADHGALSQSQHVADEIDGYMLRSTPDHVWGRVSRESAARGFDFETLGRALLYLLKSAESRVTAAEALFVTASKPDVQAFADLAVRSRETGSEMVKEVWKEQGFDVDCQLDCHSCSDEPVCDDIREVIATTKAAKR